MICPIPHHHSSLRSKPSPLSQPVLRSTPVHESISLRSLFLIEEIILKNMWVKILNEDHAIYRNLARNETETETEPAHVASAFASNIWSFYHQSETEHTYARLITYILRK